MILGFSLLAIFGVIIVYIAYNTTLSSMINSSWEESIKQQRSALKIYRPDICSNGVAPIIGWRKFK